MARKTVLFRAGRWLARHSAAEALRVVEAAACLGVARLGTLVLPFRWVARFAAAPGHGPALSPDRRTAAIAQVVGAVTTASRHVPYRAVCLQQGLAVQYMLRRRGVETELNFGVAHNAGGTLDAHAWVTNGSEVIIGGPVDRFTWLTRFPDTGPALAEQSR